jgi:hypothetical protein
MKYSTLIISVAVMMITACSSRKQNESESASDPDTVVATDSSQHQLTASMFIKPVINSGDSALLTFTVYNRTDEDLVFCKWHTPFEPPMSKFLDIVYEQGKESQYLGAMAKRVMPPPSESYIKVKAGDSLSTTVDLRKSYLIDQPGTYSVKYNSEDISNLAVNDSVTFEQRN